MRTQTHHYYIGIASDSGAGARVSGAALPVESICGENTFGDYQKAQRCAAQLAVQWANEPHTDNVEVCLVVVRADDNASYPLRAISGHVGRTGKKYARWLTAPIWWKPARKDYA